MPWIKEDHNPSRDRARTLLRMMSRQISVVQEEATQPGLESSDSSSILSQENDIHTSIPRLRLAMTYDTGTQPNNPDTFYSDPVDVNVLVSRADDDTYYKYLTTGMASDRRYSNNSERKPQKLFHDLERHSKAIQKCFQRWEQHDSITKSETCPGEHDDAIEIPDDETVNNGGLYEPFRVGLTEVSTESTSTLLQLSPAAKFRDPLVLNYVNATKLDGLDSSRRYKNNLLAVIQDGSGEDLLFAGCRSEILIFEFESRRHSPKSNCLLRFDTRPTFTSTADRIVLTWPYYPHTINYITACSNWQSGAALGVCTDDGSILVWYSSSLRREIQRVSENKGSSQSQSTHFPRVAPDVSLKLESSAWGLDFGSALDDEGRLHHILIASSNSQAATLYYYDKDTSTFNHVNSHQLLHNVPDVSVLKYQISGNKHQVTVSCGSISGELVLFMFKFTIGHEPMTDTSNSQWPLRLGHVLFDEPVVVRRTNLGTDCWTTKPVKTEYFKPVQSIRAMTGDPFIDEATEVSQILSESRILDLASDSLVSSDLGGAAYWQFFDAPVVCLESSEDYDHRADDTSKFTNFEEEYRRIHQAYKHMCKSGDLETAFLSDTMLAVSTGSRLGLFRADTLLCISATKHVFNLDIPVSEETKWCKRILITHVIEELLCFIAVSQAGLVTIMRLCEHRGLYGMRQEHLFPNPLGLTISESSLRTITGLGVRNMSVTKEIPRFYLYILYSDGLVLTYELRESRDDITDLDF